MHRHLTASLLHLTTAAICHGELLVYEPFDYQPHNHGVMGRLEGRNGGLGFAEAWKDTASSEGYAFIYDQRGNPPELYGGGWGEGQPNWDGVVDNLPTMGGYAASSDWDRSGTLHSTRKLARSAGAMAKENGGVLWMSAVWHMPNNNFFSPVGLALASDASGFKDRAIAMDGKTDAIGAGNGRDFRNGRKRLNPIIWNQGEEVAGNPGSDLDRTKDNAIDEIRIATDFKSVISGSIPPRQEVKITKTQYDAKSDRYFLTWSSNPGETYGLYISQDAGGYKPCIAAAVEAEKGTNTTTLKIWWNC